MRKMTAILLAGLTVSCASTDKHEVTEPAFEVSAEISKVALASIRRSIIVVKYRNMSSEPQCISNATSGDSVARGLFISDADGYLEATPDTGQLDIPGRWAGVPVRIIPPFEKFEILVETKRLFTFKPGSEYRADLAISVVNCKSILTQNNIVQPSSPASLKYNISLWRDGAEPIAEAAERFSTEMNKITGSAASIIWMKPLEFRYCEEAGLTEGRCP